LDQSAPASTSRHWGAQDRLAMAMAMALEADMSCLAYGSLSKRRLDTPANNTLVTAGKSGDNVVNSTDKKVGLWQDALASLVPAEVLALHGIAMSYGTTTTGSGESAVTKITHPDEMTLVYIAMMIFAAGLFLATAGSLKKLQWARALIPVTAFVLWTMIQPSTAFDALGFDLSSFARMMIAVFGAVALGALSAYLAKRADADHI
jgi:hypothetical protein